MRRKRTMTAGLLVLTIGSVLAAIGIAAAFFTERVSDTKRIATGALYFSADGLQAGKDGAQRAEGARKKEEAAPGFGIFADVSALDSHLLPYQSGEAVELSYRTALSGSAEAAVLPRLTIRTEHIKKGDVIKVYGKGSADGTGEAVCLGTLSDELSQTDFYLSPECLKPGEKRCYAYRIEIERLQEGKPLLLDAEFTLAGVQKNGNERYFGGGRSGAWIYEQLSKRERGENAELIGFYDVCGAARSVDRDGKPLGADGGKENVRYYAWLKPTVEAGKSEKHEVYWYSEQNGNERLLKKTADSAGIYVLLGGRNEKTVLRYLVKNEAGAVASERFCFQMTGGKPSCTREAYDGNLSDFE